MNACVDRTVSRRWRGARARRHRRAVSTPRPRPHDLQVAREDRDVERLQSNPLHILGADGQQVFSYVGHMRFGHEPEHVVRYQGQLGSLPGAPLGPGLARRAVEDVRLEARLVLLRLRLRATPQEHTRRRRGERRRRENRRRVERDRGLRLVAAGAALFCEGGHALRVGSRPRRWLRRHRCRRLGHGSRGVAAVTGAWRASAPRSLRRLSELGSGKLGNRGKCTDHACSCSGAPALIKIRETMHRQPLNIWFSTHSQRRQIAYEVGAFD